MFTMTGLMLVKLPIKYSTATDSKMYFICVHFYKKKYQKFSAICFAHSPTLPDML